MTKTRANNKPNWEQLSCHSLKKRQLLSLIARLLQILYMDYDASGRTYLNPEKHWHGADVCEQIASLLCRFDLAPLEPMPWHEIR